MAVFSGEATVRTNGSGVATNAACARVSIVQAAANPGSGSSLNASANQLFEVTPGVAVTIYWDMELTQANTANGIWVAVYYENDGSFGTSSGPGGSPVFSSHVYNNANTGGAGSVSFTPPKAGTYRLYVWMTSTNTVEGTVSADSDGFFSQSGTWTTSEASKGYIRAGTTVTSANISNASPTGSAPSPWAYPDKVYSQMVVGTGLILDDQSLTFTNDVENGTGAVSFSDTVTPGATTTWSDSTGIGPTTQATPNPMYVRLGLPANSPLSGIPAWHYTSVPAGWTLGANASYPSGAPVSANGTSIISPSQTFTGTLSVEHLLQANSNTFQTPPDLTNATKRLTTDLGFISCRITNARGEGQSGLSLSHKLQDSGALTTAQTWGPDTTTTEGGQAGWDPTLQPWTSTLPGGNWLHTVTCSTSGATTLTNSVGTFVLLAKNPNYVILAGLGPTTPTAAETHVSPGQDFLCGFDLVDFTTRRTIPPDPGSMFIMLGRFNLALGRAEYLNSDGTWQPVATLQTAETITAATNASPIQLTVTAHGYSTGDVVFVSGVAGNTAANGEWTITYVDANNFTLNNSTGNAAYTSGGTSQRLTRSTIYEWPAMRGTEIPSPFTLPDPSSYVVVIPGSASSNWAGLSWSNDAVSAVVPSAGYTVNWAFADVFIQATCTVNGTPYFGSSVTSLVDTYHPHSGLTFDAVAFATSGIGLISTT